MYYSALDGSQEKLIFKPGLDLFDGAEEVSEVIWSPNGKYLFVVARHPGEWRTYYLWDFENETEPQPLSLMIDPRDSSSDWDIIWADDSLSFYYSTDYVIRRYYVETGEDELIYALP